MKKSVIVSLAAIGAIAAYMHFHSADEGQETSQAEPATRSPARATVEPTPEEFVVLESERLASEELLSEKPDNGGAQDVKTLPLPELAVELTQMGWFPRMRAFRESFAPRIADGDWKEALAALNQFPPGSPEAHLLRRCRPEALNKIGENFGSEAMSYVFDQQRPDDIEACLKGWILSKPDEAIAWLTLETDPIARAEIWNAHAKGLQANETHMARNSAKGFLTNLAKRHGVEKAEEVFQRVADDVIASDDPGSAYLSEMFTVLANETVATKLAETDDGLDGSAEWLRGHLGQPYVTEAAVSRTLELLTRQDGGEAAIGWMDGSMAEHPSMDAALYDPIITEWGNLDGLETVGLWLNEQAGHPQYDRLVYAYAKKVMMTDPERAVMWAKSISDEELRAELLRGGEIFE